MAVVPPVRRQIQVCIGKAGLPVGELVYARQGRREHCAFAPAFEHEQMDAAAALLGWRQGQG